MGQNFRVNKNNLFVILLFSFLVVSFVSVRVHAEGGLYFSYSSKMAREYSGQLQRISDWSPGRIGSDFGSEKFHSDQSADQTFAFDIGWNTLNIEASKPLLSPMLEFGFHLESPVQFTFDRSTYTANFSNLFINLGCELGFVYSYVGLSLPVGLLVEGDFRRVKDGNALNFGFGAQIGVGVFYKNIGWEILAQREYDESQIERLDSYGERKAQSGASIGLSSLRYGSQVKFMF